MPADQTPAISPADMSKMADMKTMPKSVEESKKKNPDAGKLETPAPEKK